MRSVADAFKDDTRLRVAAMTPLERIVVTERLALDDLELYRGARGITVEEARRRLRAMRKSGRRPSATVEVTP